jgi:hypothetical protein
MFGYARPGHKLAIDTDGAGFNRVGGSIDCGRGCGCPVKAVDDRQASRNMRS